MWMSQSNPTVCGKLGPTRGPGETKLVWDALFRNKEGLRQMQLSQLHLVSCPGASAWTNDRRLGTDVRMENVSLISIPEEYLSAAYTFASASVKADVVRGKYRGTMQQKLEVLKGMICTLEYTSWEGMAQGPFQFQGNGNSNYYISTGFY